MSRCQTPQPDLVLQPYAQAPQPAPGEGPTARCGSLEAGLGPLVAECAYEQWHRMLFARLLAENNLPMYPEGVPVTLEECAELAPEEGDPDAWATAARYASLMLPGIFGGGVLHASHMDSSLVAMPAGKHRV